MTKESDGATLQADTGPRESRYGIGYNVARSVFNHYWVFSFIPLTTSTLGMGLAAFSNPWRWDLWAVMMVFFWIVDQGMKTLDISEEDLAVEMDARIQRAVGFLMVGTGAAIGITLAWMSTWAFLAVLLPGFFLGLAYNLEWFGGRLHDKEFLTGWGNLGLVLGWLTTMTGYLLLAEQVTLGVVVFAVGPTLWLGTVIWTEADLKELIYEDAGFEYTRETELRPERLQERVHTSNLLTIVAFGAMAAGVVVESLVGAAVAFPA